MDFFLPQNGKATVTLLRDITVAAAEGLHAHMNMNILNIGSVHLRDLLHNSDSGRFQVIGGLMVLGTGSASKDETPDDASTISSKSSSGATSCADSDRDF